MDILRYVLRFVIYTKKEICNILKLLKIDMNKKFESQRLRSQSIKLCHSLEKGLSLKEPRPGFGINKVEQVLSNLEVYIDGNYNMDDNAIEIIQGVLQEYIEFQKINGFNINKIIDRYKNIFSQNESSDIDKAGGVLEISDINITNEEKEALFKVINTRHSLRDYTDEEITMEEIDEAVGMALKAPSACNRQPTRVYVIDKAYSKDLVEFLDGSGGFENYANKYLIVTSDISAFGLQEKNQWIVSTGIFVGYLSITLHAKGIGACIVERNLESTTKNKKFACKFGIPDEEQIICAISIGKYPSKFNVPLSKRYNTNYILRKII